MEDDPLMDDDIILPPEYIFTPIRALRMSSRNKISKYLDLDGVLVVINNLDVVNNFNGLSELIGFSYLDIRNIGNQKSPTLELLDQWTVKEQCENATIGNLWTFLFKMERYDVLKDCRNNILHDCRVYEEHAQMEVEIELYRREKMDQDPRVTNSERDVDETKAVSVDDVKTGEMTMYDAFICYEVDDEQDRQFVRMMIRELEQERQKKDKTERNLKLFVPGRDDLPGSAEHTINAYLIEKRCRRMVILMSKSFWNSNSCDFQTKFAHALAPGAKSKKLIPVIREKGVPLPRILKFLAVCDFTKTDMMDWVWDRLYTAIVAPIPRKDDDDYEDSENCSFDNLIQSQLSNKRPLDETASADSTERRSSGMNDVRISSHSMSAGPIVPGNIQNVPNQAKAAHKPSKRFTLFGNSKRKKQEKELKKAEANSEILNRDMRVADSRDYRSNVYVPQNQPTPADGRVAQCYANGTNDVGDSGQAIPAMREPVENVDSTRRISSESFTMGTPPSSMQTKDEVPAHGIEHMLTRPARNSSDCDQVTSTTSSPIFV